jgi:hypothetical protein
MMYMGTTERMAWVKCPAIDADISKVKWSAEGVFLNGGAFVRSSSAAHKRYQFSWNLATQEDIYDVLNYADGLFGDGLIYFLDPFARTTNVLPAHWAAPRLQAVDAPPLTIEARPTLAATASNTFGYPTMSAVYTIGAGSTFSTLWIPLPSGYTMNLGFHGSATGTAAMTYTTDGGSPVDMTPITVTSSVLCNTTVTGTTGVTLSAGGVGQITLSGAVVQVLAPGETASTGNFISGRGHSGCRFVGAPAVRGYSSALDKIAASAVLVETGAWEQ